MPGENQPGNRHDPLLNWGYVVQIGESTIAEFTEISGISNESEVVDYQEGGENSYQHRFRGRNKYTNLVLTHGVTQLSPALWAWREAVIYGATPPMLPVAVIKLDDHGDEICRWHFKNCWPVKWRGPEFKAGAAEIAVETLELAHDGFRVDDEWSG